MEPKKLWSTSWVQSYSYNQVTMPELEALRYMVIEQMLDAEDFKEADELIARIKTL